MAFEWVAGLFQSEEARGLSGESASSVALDDANPYYNYRLRRHATEGDLVGDPGLLWYTSPYVTQRQGLGTHVAAEPGEGVTNYTDVLLILSREDFDRAQRATGEAWATRAARTLQQEFENFCRRENLQRPHAHRPLGFRLLCDGSSEMHGLSLNLQRGEFITGLLPNLYTGTVFGSYPVIGVHVNLPGVWEGYREVGRLHNDQILFTLGSHWLDNFSHPALAEAALYRLQQYPDGSFVHIVNPDLADRYQVTSTVQNNASVLTLSTREGRPLAYLVLAVMEPPSSQAPAPNRASTPRIDIPQPAARRSDFDQPIPSVAPPMLIDDEVQPVLTSAPGLGGKTIIPDAPSERIFTLQERGALLQKVHFSAFMLGYDVYMGMRGELGTKVEHPAATFEVRKRSTALVAHVPGVTVGGEPVPVGEQIPLDRNCEIAVGDTRFEFRDLRKHLDIEGWPYVGEIRRPASSTYLIWGEEYRVGRSRECRVVLPDQTANDNIHWKPNIADGGYIRARTGDIPMANFYTDSIMVSSEHATIDLTRSEPRVECNASHCFVFVRRAGELLTLHPSSKADHAHELSVVPGDEVLIGNCLFQVGFSPSGGAAEPAPAPAVLFSADSLANAVPSPNFAIDDEPAGDDDATAPEPPVPVAAEVEEPWEDEVSAPVTAEIPEDQEDARRRPDPDDEPREVEDEQTPAEGAEAPEDEATPGADDAPHEDPGADDAPGDDAPATETVLVDHDDDEDDEDDEAETAMWTIPSRDEDDVDPPAAGALGATGGRPAPYRPPPVQDSIIGEIEPPQPPPPEPRQGDTFNSELGDPDDGPEAEESAPPRPGPKIHVWEDDQPGADLTEPPPPAEDYGDEPESAPLSVPTPFPDLVSEDEATAEALPEPPEVETPPPPPRADTPPPPPRAVTPPPPPRAETPPPPAESPAAAPPPPRGLGEVVATDDAEAQFELGRPCHVILAGWMLNGEAVVGNHTGADLVLPENRIEPDQRFQARDYLRLKVRGRKGTLEVLAPTEVLIDEADAAPGEVDDVEQHTIDILRRDADGEEDFAVRLQVREDKKLPDPRARLVALDYEDALAAALVTRGLPRNQSRTLALGDMTLTLTYDGTQVAVSDYLASYRDASGGFRPFFVQSGDKRFTTAPEDGARFSVGHGDRLVIGQAVYIVRVE